MTLFRPRPPGARAPDLVDFLETGAYEGLDTHPLLDTVFYAAGRADLQAAFANGMPALLHYRSFGAAEGLNPHPLFDTRFYLGQCPEALRPGSDPLSHYLQTGWRAGFDPHPLFSTTYYLQHGRDVANAGLQPLLHYLSAGQHENRVTSPLFDPVEYARRYPDIVSSGLTPLLHYVWHGANERRYAGPLAAFRTATQPQYDRPSGVIDFAREEQDSYLAWVRGPGRLTEDVRAARQAETEAFGFRPTVSILCHVTAGTADGVGATLGSLQAQVYDAWQLCAVLDPGVSADLVAVLAAAGPQVVVVRRGTAAEPAFALNAGLDAASGEFSGVMEPGDRLHGLALSSMVGALQARRGAAMIYSDEDWLDASGFHVDPVFKPDWSPDLLPGLDYLCRGTLVRTALLREHGGFRPGFDGAADHDLALRVLPVLQREAPVHVARPLYHRLRRGDGAAAAARQDGLYRAVKEQARGRGFESTVTRGRAPGHLRVAFEPQGEPLVSVVIPTANATFAGPLGRESVLENCVRSLQKATSWKALEIIVVHDGNLSSEQMRSLGKAGVTLVAYDRPVFNFSRKINLGVRAGRGEYVLILNDDIEARRPDWLHRLMGYAQQPGIGIVGPKLYFPDGRLQHTGIVVQHGNPGHLYYRADGTDAGYLEMNDTPRNWLAVTGACQVLRRTTFEAVGGYDEDLPLNFNDVDFCLRIIDAGLRVVYEPHAELYHFEGVSKVVEIGNQLTTPYETDYFQARWRLRYPVDPFYSPHLQPYWPLGVKRADEIRGTAARARKLPAAALASSRTKGVNWLGPVNRSSGLGTASRGYVAALQAAGLQTRLVPLDKLFGHQATIEHDMVSTPQDFPISIVHSNADTTDVLFENYGDELGRAKYRIGFWVWELPAARPEWFAAIRRYDEIWVPSGFCQTAFQAITRQTVTVVPHALVDLPVLGAADRAATRRDLGITADAFVFLYMFDTYSFVDRKNPIALLDAFEAEFADKPDVVLLLKISYMANLNSSYSADNQAVLLKLEHIQARCPNVRVISEVLPSAGVYAVIHAADCYVSPHRSEGFGLTVAEAMHYGKVVIATDFGGTTDFVQEGVALPLEYRLIELPENRGPYGRGGVWADPSVPHLRALMRQVATDPALCRTLGDAAATAMASRFTPDAVGQIARRRLRTIAAELG